MKQTQERVIQQMGALDASARQERESRLVLEQLYNHLREMTATLTDQQQAEAVLAVTGDRSEDIRNQVSGCLQQHVDTINAALKELATRNDMSELLKVLNTAELTFSNNLGQLDLRTRVLEDQGIRRGTHDWHETQTRIAKLESDVNGWERVHDRLHSVEQQMHRINAAPVITTPSASASNGAGLGLAGELRALREQNK